MVQPLPVSRMTRALLAVLLLLAAAAPHASWVSAADADPLQDFCVALNSTQQQQQGMLTLNGLPCKPAAQVQSCDFASSQLRKAANFTGDLGVAVNLATALSFGALNTQGLSIARIDFKPKGLNPPHVHPRATEVLYLAEGTLLVGFVSATAPNNSLFYQTINAGDLFVFPRGLVHFQLNTHKSKPALAISALNSQNPGVSQVAAALFDAKPPLPDQVLEATFGVGDDELRQLTASVKKTLM